jgi:hypothetical protein
MGKDRKIKVEIIKGKLYKSSPDLYCNIKLTDGKKTTIIGLSLMETATMLSELMSALKK